jgi:hypothetical protein
MTESMCSRMPSGQMTPAVVRRLNIRRCGGPRDSSSARNHSKVQVLTRFISGFSDLREILRSVSRPAWPSSIQSRECVRIIHAGFSIRVSTAKPIAGKSIRPSKCSQPLGRPAARSTGGSENGESGWAVYEVQTGVNDRSKLLLLGPSQEGKRPWIKSGSCCAQRSRRSLGPDQYQLSRCPSRRRFPAR